MLGHLHTPLNSINLNLILTVKVKHHQCYKQSRVDFLKLNNRTPILISSFNLEIWRNIIVNIGYNLLFIFFGQDINHVCNSSFPNDYLYIVCVFRHGFFTWDPSRALLPALLKLHCRDLFSPIQRGPLSLVKECRGLALIGRKLHSVAMPALLCHKEPALLGLWNSKYFACSSLVLYGIRASMPGRVLL